MPTEILEAIQQLSGIVERLGVVGLLIAAVAWLVHERVRLMRELMTAYRQRDRWRLAATKYRAALDAAHIAVDTTDLQDLIES